MATATSSTPPLLHWELALAEGPCLSYHVACTVGMSVYIHGGITKSGSTHPSDKLYRLDVGGPSRWVEVTAAGSPSLSHHAAVVLERRYMVLVGGWDGRQRVSHVHVFDTQEQRWIPSRDTGFPDGAGLSSHAAVLLNTGEILIVGREGSLRIQRKHGNVYILSGNLLRGEFTYRKMTNNTSSRSGHSVNGVGNTLYIIGGRDDQLVEFHGGFSCNEPTGSLTSQIADASTGLKPMGKPPSGRKNHVSVAGQGCILMHGGDTFDGRSREPVGEMFLVTVKPHLQFYKLGSSDVKRSGHVCVSTGDRVMIHGGLSGKGTVNGDTYRLALRTK